MAADFGESVKVMAVFEPGSKTGVEPVKFKWSGRVYRIKEITYSWKSNDGGRRFVHFSVSDGASLYELRYDVAGLAWTMEGVQDHA